MTLLELLSGDDPDPQEETVEELLAPDLAFRLRVQHEVEDAILEMYQRAHPGARPKLPPQSELKDGVIDRAALTARWHAVRALGRQVSDDRVTELLEEGAARIAFHETERRARAAALSST